MKKVLAVFALSLFLSACSTKPKTTSTVPTSTLSKGAQIAQIPPEVLRNALNALSKNKEAGLDFASGPCLGPIGEDWVLDIAHNPRQPVDEKTQNQCTQLKDGSAKHFIEMDESGQIIQAL